MNGRRAKQHDERLRRDRRGLERELRDKAELEAGPRDDPEPLPRIDQMKGRARVDLSPQRVIFGF